MALVPSALATVTFTVPSVPGGAITVSVVELTTVVFAPGTAPKLTMLPAENPDPEMVTVLPPEADPEFGLIPVTTGGAIYVYLSALVAALVPAGVETVTSTVPAEADAGTVAVRVVLLTTLTPVAATVPKSTVLAPLNPVPVIVTVEPPVRGPLDGLIPVTATGGATTAMLPGSANPP